MFSGKQTEFIDYLTYLATLEVASKFGKKTWYVHRKRSKQQNQKYPVRKHIKRKCTWKKIHLITVSYLAQQRRIFL